MFIGGVNIIRKTIIFSLLFIFILIPTAYAADMDDSIANDNLAVDDSSDMIVDDGASIQDDSLGDNLKSVGLKEAGINQDKKSVSQNELLEDSDDNPEMEEDDSDGEEDESDGEDDSDEDELEEDDSEGEEDDSEYEEDDFEDEYDGNDPYVFYSDLPEKYSYLDSTHAVSPKTILDPCIEQYSSRRPSSRLVRVSARFLDKNGEALKDTYVIFLVNHEEFRVKTDSDGIAVMAIILHEDCFFAIINPATGEWYVFPERMRLSVKPIFTTGLRHNGNSYMFTLNSNGVKSTIKNEKGIVSKAITLSRDKVILSTKDNDDTEQIVVDRFTRYSVYLIAILCIVIPIGILRYRKKGS